ncbi:MAG: protein-glutamate O-methyltransferase CheR [Phycisphaerales bacterium]
MTPLSSATLGALVRMIHAETGIAIGPDKHYLLHHRLEPVMAAHGIASFEDLVARLGARATARELRADVIDAVAIHETSFFRDPDVFAAIAQHVLAPAFTAKQRPLRIWSAAASTGQEAWSLAMLVAEALGGASATWPSRASILASDISPHTIAFARDGRYSSREIERGLSDARVARYFRPVPKSDPARPRFDVCADLRSLVQFNTFNLIESLAPLGQFDLVLCRNVLIYFDDATRARVIHAITDAIVPGGHLVLGAAESLYGMDAASIGQAAPIATRLEPTYFPRAVIYRRAAR